MSRQMKVLANIYGLSIPLPHHVDTKANEKKKKSSRKPHLLAHVGKPATTQK